MTSAPGIQSRALDELGYSIVPRALGDDDVERLLSAIAPLAAGHDGRGGVRNLLDDSPAVRELARSPAVRAVAEAALGLDCFAVRGILFDKTPGANWKVIWHQDLTIAVRERRDGVPGFGPWSEKDGVPHVQPPAELLSRMIAVRVHLDDCGADNGPVRVLPGSHIPTRRLPPDEIDAWRARAESVDCLVQRGGLLAMRPLLLHASSPATAPAHRRVIHLEFAADELPGGLEWRWRV